MKWPNQIIIEMTMHHGCHIVAKTTNEKYAKAFFKRMKDNGYPGEYSRDFIVSEYDTRLLKAGDLRILERGWTVRHKIDPWIVGHYFGWDAHTAVKGGQ